jgi:hypothetical protein
LNAIKITIGPSTFTIDPFPIVLGITTSADSEEDENGGDEENEADDG